MFFMAEKQQKSSELFFRFINCNRIISIAEHHRILNLLNEANDSKFVTRKWNMKLSIIQKFPNLIFGIKTMHAF